MKSLLFASAAFVLLFNACNSDSEKKTQTTSVDSAVVDTRVTDSAQNNLLITNETFGNINNKTDFGQLQKLFGEKNVIDEMEYGAEGLDSFMVTRIFAHTSKEITIGWKQKKFHKAISYVESVAKGSPYYTTDSLAIGNTLEKLLKVNGKKINFYGTGWDYGGTITSYNKGKLDDTPLYFQLTDMEGMTEKLMGDQELNTDMPLVKDNLKKLVISKISVTFN